MWSSEVTNMIITGIWETLYMTLVSTLVGYVIGLPMGIILTVSDKDGIKPNAVLYKILDVIANIVRSVPFIILLVLLIPFTRLVVGKSYGSTATIVPLVIAAAPYIARMVESSLKEVDENLQLKKYPGIYVCGEALDVDGDCGGYNLHFAFASGVHVAKSF